MFCLVLNFFFCDFVVYYFLFGGGDYSRATPGVAVNRTFLQTDFALETISQELC